MSLFYAIVALVFHVRVRRVCEFAAVLDVPFGAVICLGTLDFTATAPENDVHVAHLCETMGAWLKVANSTCGRGPNTGIGAG